MQQLSNSFLKEISNNPYTKCVENISVLCKENVFIINGRAANYHQKQMIQEVFKKFRSNRTDANDLHLQNEVVVEYTPKVKG